MSCGIINFDESQNNVGTKHSTFPQWCCNGEHRHVRIYCGLHCVDLEWQTKAYGSQLATTGPSSFFIVVESVSNVEAVCKPRFLRQVGISSRVKESACILRFSNILTTDIKSWDTIDHLGELWTLLRPNGELIFAFENLQMRKLVFI